LLLVNLVAFFWSDELGAARDARRARTLLRERELGEIVRIVATDRWRLTRMARARLRNAHPGRLRHGPGDHEVPAALDALRDGDVETLLLLSFSEPLFDDFVADALLERLGEWPNLHLDRVATNDHVFRSLWSQRQVHEALDGALGRTLAETGRRAETD
jgi:hypothetical protein